MDSGCGYYDACFQARAARRITSQQIDGGCGDSESNHATRVLEVFFHA